MFDTLKINLNHQFMKGILLLIFSSLFFSLSLTAQKTDDEVRSLIVNSSESELVRENSSMIQENYMYQAEMIADKLITLNPESSNYNYRKGYLMTKVHHDFNGAISYLEKAIVNTDVNFDAYSSKEKSAPVDAFYHLALCYHATMQLDKAIEFYNKFIADSKASSELIKEARLRIEQCAIAKNATMHPINVRLKNVGNTVNSINPEYASVISLDGTSLYFTSKREWENGKTDAYRDPIRNQNPEDIYVSYMNPDSTWTSPERIAFCLPGNSEATMAVSSDERRIYIYEDSTGYGDIYYSDFYSGKFNDIKYCDVPSLNSEFWETHCMVSADGSRMFFTSDRPGGFGGKDIYLSQRISDTSWSAPVNLGPRINGPNDEDAPFVSIDNRMLYFATNGNRSMGGYDIMVCDLLEDGTWSDARNLGYPFNSTEDDLFYTTTVDGLRGFMTTSREGGMGDKDIYEIQNDFLGVQNVAVFRGTVKTTDNSELPEDFAINVRLTCDDCEPIEQNRSIFPRLRDGQFMTGLKPCKTYQISYFSASDDVVVYEETFTTKCDVSYQEIIRNYLLDVKNKQFVFPKDTTQNIDPVIVSTHKNIEFIHYFDYNKNKLFTNRGELKDFVKEVEKQLKDGREKVTINIYSSSSKVPTRTYESNENLAKIRAENMKYDLTTYFDNIPELKGKVNVVIVTTIVDGPEYNKDYRNKDKYKAYQFVGLKTE
jgi:tetratricopeptide (TPR) repeat protein